MAKRNSTTKTVAVEQLPMGKVVRYNRENADFDFYFDRQYLGSRATEHDARECVNEYVYDLERSGAMYSATQLDAGSSVEEIAADTESAPIPLSAPTVTANTWQGEAGATYTDFSVGTGLTGVMVGTHGGTKDGIELIIGGACINERSDEVITIDDVRQLRDNLTALLNDPGVLAAIESTPQPPTPAAPAFPIPTVPAKTKNGSWQAQIGELDGLPVTGFYAGRELMHATVVYQGVPVGIYAADSGEYVNAGIGEGLGFGGDMHFSEWRALAALGRTDIVDRLLILFRQYATAQGGTQCEECGARLLPDDEDQLCVRCHQQRWQGLRQIVQSTQLRAA